MRIGRHDPPPSEAVLARLDPASVDADIIPALAGAFPGFDFSLGLIDDDYRRDSRSVIRPDGTRLGALHPWMMAELGRESEFRDGPIVNRESRPRWQEELLDPNWRGWDRPREEDRLVGPIYCLVNRRGGDVVHTKFAANGW